MNIVEFLSSLIFADSYIAFLFSFTIPLQSHNFVKMTDYCLGIDIGTTSIKIALFDSFTDKVVLFNEEITML